jgi:hypothetical protein
MDQIRQEAPVMRLARVRLTIRTLMIGVLAVGGLLALLREWPDLLPVFVLVVIPLAGLIGLRTQVPPQRPPWRFGISAALFGLIILGAGWFWARCVIWYFQTQVGFEAIGAASRGEDYQFWGSTIPSRVTGICLMVY